MGDIKLPQQGEMHALAGYHQFSGRVEACLEFNVPGKRGGFRGHGIGLGGCRVRRRYGLFSEGDAATDRGQKADHANGNSEDARGK
jgi:hypothetical protein